MFSSFKKGAKNCGDITDVGELDGLLHSGNQLHLSGQSRATPLFEYFKRQTSNKIGIRLRLLLSPLIAQLRLHVSPVNHNIIIDLFHRMA